jgi:hypothetical protein
MAGDNPTSPPSALTAAMQLVRENGLIVLALVALMWQVWFASTNAREQQIGWRATIDTMQKNALEEQRQRSENIQKLTEAMVKIYEVMKTTQGVIADMEEECQSTETVQKMQKGRTQ